MDPITEARGLEGERRYREARAVLEPALAGAPDDGEVRVRLAVCVYKDPDLPLTRRLDNALRILTERIDGNRPEGLPDQESLGVAGAIFKRKWEADGQERNLYRALALYRRAAEEGIDADDGYTAINAAFVLDLLADLERRQDSASSYHRDRRAEADDWRRRIVDSLKPRLERGDGVEWWPLVTIAEALIGLGHAEEAEPWVQKAAGLKHADEEGRRPKPWEIESTARQVAALIRLRQDRPDVEAFSESAAGMRLQELLGPDWSAGLETAWIGKIGLALSGGGFRASLFHIGVLARLAELDVLRRVEVLSCVSGGSIIGAYYYLKVRQLLQDKPDAQLDREDYLKLVGEIERDFLEAIGSNVRMRLLTSPVRVFQMAVARGYTRTERAGQLYQEKLYSQLGSDDFRLPDLLVHPAGEESDFKPKHDNWRRSAKVPILVINATTMNTGHNWQYTASWMGEPPSSIDDDVDSADRLRRMYHDEAPEKHARTPLGRAVAASAAVPGLFPPISKRNLYPGVTVRLSDGGVHDNQGIASLLEQDCAVILVSDASGQGQPITKSGDRALPTLSRTMSVAMARIRQAQAFDLAARRAASSLRGLMFVHLKQDLPRVDRTWEGGATDPSPPSPDQRDTGLTPYGVRQDVQRKLATIRTDLDAFHGYEAHGLMASGYRMVEHYFPKGNQGFPTADGRHEWRFCALQSAMEGAERHSDLLAALERSDKLFFKWFRWPRVMAALVLLVVLTLLGGAVWAAAAIGGWAGVCVLLAGVLVAGVLCALPDDRLPIHLVTLVAKVPLGAVAMVLAPLVTWPYLLTLNRWYLANGRAPSTPRKWDSPGDAPPMAASPQAADHRVRA